MVKVTNWVPKEVVRTHINVVLKELDEKLAALNEELTKTIEQKSESRIVSAGDFHRNKEEILRRDIEDISMQKEMMVTYLALSHGDGNVKVEFEL